MKKYLFVACFLMLLLSSCPNGEPSGRYKYFWAKNMRTNIHYRLPAELLAEGRHCEVWVEKGCGVYEDTAQNVADVYDNDIYPKMMDIFSIKNFKYEGETFSNIMDFAGWLAGDNGSWKLCILLLDIKDNYIRKNDPYVAGYFWAGNFFQNYPNSNECVMIYIDTKPGIPGSKESNATLAHEMQHLINHVTSYALRYDDDYYYTMDIWIDEGLSAAAEWVYEEEYSSSHIQWYNDDPSGEIKLGNNFFVWDNRRKNSYAILDDYTTVYLFFQWLRLQANRESIYKDIITSRYYDHRSVVGAFYPETAPDDDDSVQWKSLWEKLLRDWLAANYIGYPDEKINIKAHTLPKEIKTISLAPGEGVYSIIPNDSFSMPINTGNIRYSKYADALLTYNVNTTKISYSNGSEDGVNESGMTTGNAAENAAIITGGRFISSPFTGPFRISADDMLRRNGHGGSFLNRDRSGLMKGIEADE